MKKIAFEKVDYQPYELVKHLINLPPVSSKKRDPRILPLLDRDGSVKAALLKAIADNIEHFKRLVKTEIVEDTKKLCWDESSNLLAHLLCAQRRLGGVKAFGSTKSSISLLLMISSEFVPNMSKQSSRDESDSEADYHSAESCSGYEDVKSRTSANSVDALSGQKVDMIDPKALLVDILGALRNSKPDAMTRLIVFLAGMTGSLTEKEMIIRGQSLDPEQSDKGYEVGSLMEMLIKKPPSKGDGKSLGESDGAKVTTLFDLKIKYGSDQVVKMLRRLPRLTLLDVSEKHGLRVVEGQEDFVDQIKKITERPIVEFIKNNRDFKALASVKSRKMTMMHFAGIPPCSPKYKEACQIIKQKFGKSKLNASLFSREIKAMLLKAEDLDDLHKMKMRANAIRLCAAADRRSFLVSLLLSNSDVRSMLKEKDNAYIPLFSDRLKNELEKRLDIETNSLSQGDYLASRPLTVKLTDFLGLYSVRPTQAVPKGESVVYKP